MERENAVGRSAELKFVLAGQPFHGLLKLGEVIEAVVRTSSKRVERAVRA